jgi:hypothetical protein
MAGTSRELTITHGAQFAAQRLLGDDDAKLLENPLAKIDDPPAHDPMNRRNRAAFDDRGERRPMRVVKPGWLSRRLAVDQALRSMGVELHHPIANDLKRHPADLRRLGAPRAFVKSPPEPKAAAPAARPSIASPTPSPSAHQNQPGAEWAWRTSSVRHLESELSRFGNPQPSHAFTDLAYKSRPRALRNATASTTLGSPNERCCCGTSQR